MKKVTIGLIAAAVVGVIALAALGTASFVSAQTSTPQAPTTPWGGMMNGRGAGYGMMGRGAGMTLVPAPRASVGGYAAGNTDSDGVCGGAMHDSMVASLAEKLGLTVDAINTRLANGETMAQIATAQGLSQADFFAWMQQARSQALAQAVAAGTITQAQADWMNQRGAGMMGAGAGYGRMGAGAGYGRMGGRGAGMMGGYANQNGAQGQYSCPWLQQGQ